MSRKVSIWVGAGIALVLVIGLLAGTVLAQGSTRVPRTSWGRRGGSGLGGGGMMGSLGGGGMMDSWGDAASECPGMGGWTSPGTGTPITLDQAVEAAQEYLAAYGNPDLALAEVMEFTQNFYAEVEEISTGVGAFELLIDRYTGSVYPEPGPNMMWNTKYGHMGDRGGMTGGSWDQLTGSATVTPEEARTQAQEYLDGYLPGASVDDEVDAFYGYLTLHVLQDGEVIGMLSVNGYTGAVWYHTWHGDFIAMRELEA